MKTTMCRQLLQFIQENGTTSHVRPPSPPAAAPTEVDSYNFFPPFKVLYRVITRCLLPSCRLLDGEDKCERQMWQSLVKGQNQNIPIHHQLRPQPDTAPSHARTRMGHHTLSHLGWMVRDEHVQWVKVLEQGIKPTSRSEDRCFITPECFPKLRVRHA